MNGSCGGRFQPTVMLPQQPSVVSIRSSRSRSAKAFRPTLKLAKALLLPLERQNHTSRRRAALAKLAIRRAPARHSAAEARGPEAGRKMSVAEERLLSMWPRRMVADFRGLEADEALLRNASAHTLALSLGAFPALLMPLPAATQNSIATVALTLYQGAAASRSVARHAGVRCGVRSGAPLCRGTSWLSRRPAGSTEAARSSRSCLRLPQASVGLGQQASGGSCQ